MPNKSPFERPVDTEVRGEIVEFKGKKIEIVSKIESWLLDEHGGRIRRVCGHKLSGRDGYCLEVAGKGTSHVGYGYCKAHDPKTLQKRFKLWKQMQETWGIIPTVAEAMAVAEEIEDEEFNTVGQEIRFLYALLLEHMKDRETNKWTKEDKEFAITIVSEIIKAKTTEQKLKKSISLESRTITAFVDQVFTQIVLNTDKQSAEKIMTAIMSNVIVPLTAAAEYHPKSTEYLYKKIGDKLEGKGLVVLGGEPIPLTEEEVENAAQFYTEIKQKPVKQEQEFLEKLVDKNKNFLDNIPKDDDS